MPQPLPRPIEDTWGHFIRANFDKLLLVVIIAWFLGYQLHLLHDKSDSDAVHWAREQTNTFVGALVGLITGARLGANIANAKQQEPPPGYRLVKLDDTAGDGEPEPKKPEGA